MNQRTKVACLIPEKLIWEGTTRLLSQYNQLITINSEPSHMSLNDLIQSGVDVVVADFTGPLLSDLPDLNAISLCSKLKGINPRIKVIACADKVRIESVNSFFDAGGTAFVSRKSSHTELVKSINQSLLNVRYVCPIIGEDTRNLIRFINGVDPLLKPVYHIFTPAETNVLVHISQGYSTKQIAAMLNLSEKTIETHRKHLFDKSGVKNVAELIAFAFSKKLLFKYNVS